MSLTTEVILAFTEILENSVNLVLQQDISAMQKLSNLQGKSISFYLTDLDIEFYLFPHTEGLQIQYLYDQPADTTLSGTVPAFIEMLTGDSTDTLFSGKVTIKGDIQLGQTFKRILDKLEIDWEEIFASLSNDIVAHKAGNLLRGITQWHKQAFDILKNDAREYLQDEAEINPQPQELAKFSNEIADLRNKTERLAQRLSRLQSKINKTL